MKPRQFRWLFLGALTAFFVQAFSFGPSNFGASINWSDGRYVFAGGTTPWALAIAAFIIALYFVLMYTPPSQGAAPLLGLLPRLIAFFLDFTLAMCAIGSLLGIFPALTEWRRTGIFAWNLERTSPAPGDAILVGSLTAVAFIALVFYFVWPLIRRRPTPGSCIAGYLVVPEDGITMTATRAVGRVFLGMYAAGFWIVAPFIARDPQRGKFWLDRVFRTKAVKLN